VNHRDDAAGPDVQGLTTVPRLRRPIKARRERRLRWNLKAPISRLRAPRLEPIR
jgi:hypothetical protein